MPEPNWKLFDKAQFLIQEEFYRALRKHDSMHSPHEAYAVILEEVDEYWLEVKKQITDRGAMRHELIQIAAMAIRALHDLNLLEDQ